MIKCMYSFRVTVKKLFESEIKLTLISQNKQEDIYFFENEPIVSVIIIIAKTMLN